MPEILEYYGLDEVNDLDLWESDLNEAVAKLQVMMNLPAKAAEGIVAHDGVKTQLPTQAQIGMVPGAGIEPA